ncbi:MAG: putative 4-hydroxybenzoate polyprenyltransferase [Chitinophagaceae bacterium]|nr:putative 4-hydroxybenzoate polyprenyltransferase [Chitinophagaceae bacterium]
MSTFSIKTYFSLVKFSHSIFALPFALIGFFYAVIFEHQPFIFSTLMFVIICMIFARNAAMAFNRYLDEKFDKLNPRTAQREIPAGIISKKNALLFVLINCIAFVITTFFINNICFYLSPIALFVILFYSYTKRFTSLCHLVLGLGLSLAPIGAYLAVTGVFSIVPLLFSIVVLTWVSGFDILYALQDEDFDKSQNLHSIPVLLGRKNALYFSVFLHLITAIAILYIGWQANFNLLYWTGAFSFILLLAYQHILVKPNDISKVNIAFATTNGIASILFALFTISSFFIKI